VAEIRQLQEPEREGRATSAALSPYRRLFPANDNRPPLKLRLWRIVFFIVLAVLAGGLMAHSLGYY
jgi:hypothetical protein